MLRSIAKDAAAHVVSWTGLDAVARKTVRGEVPFIVGYHRVVERLGSDDDVALPAMEVSVAMLEKHLDWLGKHFEIVSLDDLASKLNRRTRSKPFAAVTFDDGYSDVFHYGFPLLRRKGIPAGIFVVSDLIGTTELPLHERLYEALAARWPALSSRAWVPRQIQNPFAATQYVLKKFKYDDVLRHVNSLGEDGRRRAQTPAKLHPLTWDMLSTMRDAGMTIGSHTKTHAFLTNETAARVWQEVNGSRSALQAKLSTEVSCFAYPGGCFKADVVEAVYSAGYRFAFTDCRHRDARYPMLTIPRRGLWERACIDRFGQFSPAIMSCHSAAMFDRFSDCSKDH
jgi:peptidoglycan/xylan/chitin deacetylase (PgdA/CDA1 family)